MEKGKYTNLKMEGSGSETPHAIEVFAVILGLENCFAWFSDELVLMVNNLKKEDSQLFNDFAAYCDRENVKTQWEWGGKNDRFWYRLKVSRDLADPVFYAIAERSGWIARLCHIIRSLYKVTQGLTL